MITDAHRKEFERLSEYARSRGIAPAYVGNLANAITTLLRENAELATQLILALAPDKSQIDLANRRIEKLREGLRRVYGDNRCEALIADDALAKGD